MKPYDNKSGASGVTHYDDQAAGAIEVRFKCGNEYLYTDLKTGRTHIQNMKKLAAAGRGLSSYISRHVRDRYAARTRLLAGGHR